MTIVKKESLEMAWLKDKVLKNARLFYKKLSLFYRL